MYTWIIKLYYVLGFKNLCLLSFNTEQKILDVFMRQHLLRDILIPE